MKTPARVTEARLALGRRLAILRHDAGALNPAPVPVGRGGDQPTRACRSLVIVWASRRVSSPLVLTPPGFIQIDAPMAVKWFLFVLILLTAWSVAGLRTRQGWATKAGSYEVTPSRSRKEARGRPTDR